MALNLAQYWGKNVEIIDVDGKKWIGFVRGYTDANNDEDGENITMKIDGSYYGFYHEDIASIKEI